MKNAALLLIVSFAIVAAQSDARKRRAKANDSDIVLLKRVVPAFPLDAFAACTAGYALVEFTIDEKGDVSDLAVTDSEPPGIFDAAAIGAVSQWKFSPRIVNGVAMPQRVSQNIDFSIESDCVVNAALPDDIEPLVAFDDQLARKECIDGGGSEFGFAELNFLVDEDGRPIDVTVVRSTSGRYAHLAREELEERSFDAKYASLAFTHTFGFCMGGG